jgi:hypothetical protein
MSVDYRLQSAQRKSRNSESRKQKSSYGSAKQTAKLERNKLIFLNACGRGTEMSRRKANKAEAIVRGIGAIFMLMLLFVVTRMLPQILKGQSTDEMMRTMIRFIAALAVFGGVVTTIGLIVWFRVKNRR